jgi:hypothetical protein
MVAMRQVIANIGQALVCRPYVQLFPFTLLPLTIDHPHLVTNTVTSGFFPQASLAEALTARRTDS